MMQNQQQNPQGTQMSPNMSPQMNHGGHEIFDAHEVISTYISVLDQYLMFDQYVKDPELKQILNHQHTFITDVYNVTVEAFSTGNDPSHPTQQYKMNQQNDVVYGLTPSQPQKPCASLNEINDHGLSTYMLGLIKSTSSLLSMTAQEVTNPVLRRVLADSIPNFIEMSYELFLYQNKNKYYQVPQLAQQDMTQMLKAYVPTTQTGQAPLM